MSPAGAAPAVTSARFGSYAPLAPPRLDGIFAAIVRAEPVAIAAPPRAVWDVLAELASYPAWCPFTRRIDGSLEVGTQVSLHVHWGPHRPLAAEAHRVEVERVTLVEAPRALAWSSALVGLRAERLQYLEAMPDGTTRYHTYDRFAGPLVPLTMALYRRKIHAGFTAVGAALKERVETQR